MIYIAMSFSRFFSVKVHVVYAPVHRRVQSLLLNYPTMNPTGMPSHIVHSSGSR